MQVNFNNLRVQAVQAYNRLTSTLNNYVNKEEGTIASIDTEAIQKDLDDLRQMLVTLACCYLEDDPNVKSVIDECGKIEVFNKED